ncbi:MAG: SMP-30/gluconolactonase/LRE family protein [Bacteroidales bacterium]
MKKIGLYYITTVLVLLSCKTKNIMKEDINASILLSLQSGVGEGALWNKKEKLLYWIDIDKSLLHRYNPTTGVNETFSTPSKIGTVVFSSENDVIVALETGIYLFNRTDSSFTLQVNPLEGLESIRFNDGKCAPDGRFWVGTMEMACKPYAAGLYVINHDFSWKKVLDSITVSNGIVWSADGKIMYYIDSPTGKIVGFDYNNGEISNKRDIVVIPKEQGTPDGMTIDENGNLWVCMWGGAAVRCYNPHTGDLLQKINVDAANVTSCWFGGENLDTLYITSASFWIDDVLKNKFSHDGGLFYAVPGVKGTEPYNFGK